MFKLDEVKEYIKENKYNFIVDVRYRPSDDVIMIYVPQDYIVDKVRKGLTSYRQLTYLKKRMASAHGKHVDVVITQGIGHQELEEGIYQILNRKFNDQIIALYISFGGDKLASAWIEMDNSTEAIRGDIHEHLSSILAEADISLDGVSWVISQAELPSLASLLRSIKVHQPLSLQDLIEYLLPKYPSVSDKWLSRKLDQLRKKGFIRREGNGCYVLSAMALASIPAGRRYTSSDIERALALGKRKW